MADIVVIDAALNRKLNLWVDVLKDAIGVPADEEILPLNDARPTERL